MIKKSFRNAPKKPVKISIKMTLKIPKNYNTITEIRNNVNTDLRRLR